MASASLPSLPMTEHPEPVVAGQAGRPDASEDGDSLLLDRIDALRVLRAETREERDALLEQLAGRGRAEQSIVDELAKVRPLWRPDRFEESHRLKLKPAITIILVIY